MLIRPPIGDASFLTTSAVARALDISEATARGLERRGVLRAVRASNGVRLFDPESVAAERVRRESPGSQPPKPLA
ncbi:MAG: hypothetical protein R2745_03690 [Vicinamibacterales bacterium]